MAPERTRALRREAPQNPVEMLLSEAARPAATNAAVEPQRTEPKSAVLAPAAPLAAPAPDRVKKQVNYRISPELTDQLKTASIEYSFRQGRQYSQNAIVEMAIQAWLDANGPWQQRP